VTGLIVFAAAGALVAAAIAEAISAAVRRIYRLLTRESAR
jgi:hypothetical protein